MSTVQDTLARPLRDLRISITDRCNFRCTYCMPKDVFGRDHAFLPRRALLSFEEITRITRLLAELGVRKVRLTGGEPPARRDTEHLVGMLAEVDGIDDLAMPARSCAAGPTIPSSPHTSTLSGSAATTATPNGEPTTPTANGSR